MKRLLSSLLLSILALQAFAEEVPHPRIGLVLSGGGARGAAHVGVLKVLVEMRIPITAVAGTSMGALVGGAYASGVHVDRLEQALTGADWDDLCESVRRSWALNRELDRGTCPPAIQDMVGRIQPHADAFKLLGAGGGGYMLVFAKDVRSAERIREDLASNPLSPTARFVDFSVSDTGLQITRS